VAVAGPDVLAVPDEVITFDGSGSTDPDGTIISYDWDFGDTATGSGVSPTHSYTTVGTYTVTLTVTDDLGATDQDTLTVTVNHAPVAVAGPDVSATTDEVITFDGSGSTDDGTIVSYDWDFGDTAIGNGVSPTHSYSSVGYYTVTLTVTDDMGWTGQDTLTVTVNNSGPTGITKRVSVDSNGNQGNNDSYETTMSADGRYAAFDSYASNLVPGDTNGALDIFVHDRLTGITNRVSVDSDGNQGNNDSIEPTISADGRYVAFFSLASNLVAGDTNGTKDVFVHDRHTGITNRVSVDSSGNQGNGTSRLQSISADGRYVAFQSGASNLVAGDTNGTWDAFVHDRQTGTTEIVSVNSSGNQGNESSHTPSISAEALTAGMRLSLHMPATSLRGTRTGQGTPLSMTGRPARRKS
jgi:PKD repeat protein